MKKVLSIMLVAAMLCSILWMPVSAEEEIISVSAADLILGENTVLNADENSVVFDEAGDSVSFQFDATTADALTVSVALKSNNGTAHDIGTAVEIDGIRVASTLYEASYVLTNSFKLFHMGTSELQPGNHEVKIVNLEGSYDISYVRVADMDFAEGENVCLVRWGASAPIKERNYKIQSFQKAIGSVEVEMGVPKDDVYTLAMEIRASGASGGGDLDINISVDGGTKTKMKCPSWTKGNTSSFTYIDLMDLTLSKGNHKILIEAADWLNYIFYARTVKLIKMPDFSVDSVKVGETTVAEGATVNRGTDSFEINFNYSLKSDATPENISLVKTEDNAPVALEVETIGDKVAVKLKETLDFETDYTLIVSGIADEYNRELTETVLNFSTGTADDDAGDGEIIVNESETVIDNNVATIKGIVKSSAGVGIAGRCVQVVATSPSTATVYTSESVMTGEDGAFTVALELDEDGESGEHTFVVSDEYVSAEPFKKIYVSNETKLAIIDGLGDAEDADGVGEVFEAYGFALGVQYPDDLSVLEDGKNNLFLNHFVGAEFENVDVVREQYDLWLMFETLNQTRRGEKVQQILESEENCAALGLDKNAIDLIETNKNNFCEAVAAIPAQDSLDEFKAEFEVILNDYFAVEMGKLDATLDVDDVSGKMGQGAKLEIAFDDEISDVLNITLDITTDSNGIDLANSDISLDIDGTYSVKEIDDGISVEIKVEEEADLKDIITLLVTVPGVAGRHDIDINGIVTYVYNNEGYSRRYTNGIDEKTVIVTAKAAQNGGGGGGGNSSSRPVSGSVAGSPINIGTVTPGGDDVQTPEKFEFVDIANVDWAVASINELLEKGVISESADKKFNPDRNVTREEFVKMVVVAMGVYDANAVSSLKDVDENAWYAAYVASAEKVGLIKGDEKGNFGIGDEISRQDMAVIIYRALATKAISGNNGGFADDGEIADYAKTAVYSLNEMKIVNGVGGNMFAPLGTATRAMAAKVICGMIGGLK